MVSLVNWLSIPSGKVGLESPFNNPVSALLNKACNTIVLSWSDILPSFIKDK